MNRILFAIASGLSKPVGFWITLAAMIAGTIYAAFGGVSIVTYVLSVLAIIVTGIVLVEGDRNTAALHAKLDVLILAQERADNALVGIEREEPEEIEQKRADAARDKSAD